MVGSMLECVCVPSSSAFSNCVDVATLACFLRRLRRMKHTPIMATMSNSMPTPTDTPIAIFAPELSPLEELLFDAEANDVYAPDGNCEC
jgi:hypothetical protein